MHNLLNTIKEISINSVNTTNPCNWLYGTVKTTNPLSIQINSQIILTESFLTLSNNVVDHYEDLTVSFQTEEDNFLDVNAMQHTHPYIDTQPNGQQAPKTTTLPATFDTTHKHEIKHKIKVFKHLGLKVGEKVVLLKMAGGKQFYVLDRVNPPITNGEYL